MPPHRRQKNSAYHTTTRILGHGRDEGTNNGGDFAPIRVSLNALAAKADWDGEQKKKDTERMLAAFEGFKTEVAAEIGKLKSEVAEYTLKVKHLNKKLKLWTRNLAKETC